jgi:alpha-L-fucosidase
MNGQRVPWETCQTFSGSWGYYRDETSWKSSAQLIELLIDTVSKGGNLLMNVGPTARGTFDERAKDRLEAFGRWMQMNGRAIYGATQAPDGFKAPPNALLTYNPSTKRLYVHLLAWPMGEVVLDGFADKVAYAQLLHDASEVRMSTRKATTWISEEARAGDLVLRLPILKPDVEIPVVELLLK